MKNQDKKILIIVIVLLSIFVILIAGLIGGLMYSKKNKEKQQALLSSEIISINQTKKIDGNIKTKGKYAKVERAIKEYYIDYINSSMELINTYNEGILTNALTASNLSSDGPEFVTTKANITKIKNIEQTTKLKFASITSDEYIESKARELELNDYYTNLFLDYLKNKITIKEDITKFEDVIENYDKWMDKIEEIINFLSENKDNWKINENKLEFNSNLLLIKYNSLIINLKSQETTLNIKLGELNYNIDM